MACRPPLDRGAAGMRSISWPISSESRSPASWAPASSSSHSCQPFSISISFWSASREFCVRTCCSSRASASFNSCQYSLRTASSPTARSSHCAFNACRRSRRTMRRASSVIGSCAPPRICCPVARARSVWEPARRSSSSRPWQAVCCTASHAPRMLSILLSFMASTSCRTIWTNPKQPMGWPPTVFGLARHALVSCPRSASTPALNSGRRDEYCSLSSLWSCTSSLAGWTSVAQLRWLKNFSKLWRTSRPACPRSRSMPTDGAAWSACSRYSSGEMWLPDSSRSSSMKSRSTQRSAGLLVSLPRSSMCSAKRHTRASALKMPSLSVPLVFSTITDDISAHSVISCASRVRSLSVLPKPSQSMKTSRGLWSSSESALPHSHSPSVHARVVLPTWKGGSPFCMRSRRMFIRKLLPVRYSPQTDATAIRLAPCRSSTSAPSGHTS
mmetsp:Transcript_22423/g.63658  ORF Transcript_22423/g.63658 Transcript_22423/m.63658 type:complete len:442 (-) Transcript_22423:745-2070(-)